MDKQNLLDKENAAEKRAKAREKRKRKNMRVSGAAARSLSRLIREKGAKKR